MRPKSEAAASYRDPVDKLLALGAPAGDASTWLDYEHLGISSADIPILIALMVDMSLNGSSTPGDHFAPLHAWRALAQLRAVEAVGPLIELHASLADDDYLFQDFPKVMVRMGRAALPSLVHAIRRTDVDPFVRGSVAEALAAIGASDQEVRDECASTIAGQLAGFEDQDSLFNALLVSALLDLNAVVHGDVIERAMTAGRVDEMHVGDWEDVQIELGMLATRTTPKRSVFEPYTGQRSSDPTIDLGSADRSALHALPAGRGAPPRRDSSRKKQKAKRKLAKASRRRNRK